MANPVGPGVPDWRVDQGNYRDRAGDGSALRPHLCRRFISRIVVASLVVLSRIGGHLAADGPPDSEPAPAWHWIRPRGDVVGLRANLLSVSCALPQTGRLAASA